MSLVPVEMLIGGGRRLQKPGKGKPRGQKAGRCHDSQGYREGTEMPGQDPA
jgi:hypothetical protein